jgi:hypothetical protein
MSASKHDARSLAETIRRYWQARGHNPAVCVERVRASSSPTETRMVDVIRSDMVGGWPKLAPATADRGTHHKLPPDSKSDSDSPFARLSVVRLRLTANESVRASVPLWNETGGRCPL